jgi:hypothetical protein
MQPSSHGPQASQESKLVEFVSWVQAFAKKITINNAERSILLLSKVVIETVVLENLEYEFRAFFNKTFLNTKKWRYSL